MIDLSDIKNEIEIRRALLKKDRTLLVLIDKMSQTKGENHLASFIKSGRLALNADGSLRVQPLVKNTASTNGSVALRSAPATVPRSIVAARSVAPASDFGRLQQRNQERAKQFQFTAEWFELERELRNWMRNHNCGQVARVVANMAASQLNIPTPAVR